MKKVLKIIVILSAIMTVWLFGVNADAAEVENNEYSVAFEGGEYVITQNGEAVAKSISLNEALEAVSSGEGVVLSFQSVATDESLVLDSGSYVIKGTLAFHNGASLTVLGSEITISGASVSFDRGTLRIKRGSVSLTHGSVSSGGDAVTLDYSASSAFSMHGGSVRAVNGAGIMLKMGSAYVGGGTVISDRAFAIEAHSSLTLFSSPVLSGAAYDIVTDTKITLYDGEKEFEGATRVKFLSSFESGQATPVMYAKSAEGVGCVTLYDENGTKMTTKFIEGATHLSDEGVGVVFKPYFVSFFDGDEKIHVAEYVKDFEISMPDTPSVDGYVFDGWYTSESVPFDITSPIMSDISLYSKYKLTSPTYTLLSESFTYDGVARNIGVYDLSHPLIDKGFVSYQWYKDGTPLSSYSSTHSVKNVADSGSYSVKITFTVGKDTEVITTPETYVSITHRHIEVPSARHSFYTGAPIASGFNETAEYFVSNTEGTLVGIYPVSLTLKDYENYRFVGTDKDTVYVDFIIDKAENCWTVPLAVSDIYTSDIPKPTAAAKFGEAVFTYAPLGSTVFTDTPPTEAGIYTVRAAVAATENYTGLESQVVRFEIILEEVVGISVKTPPNKLSYIAFEHFIPDGIEIEAVYNSGRICTVGADEITFLHQSDDYFLFGDSGVTVIYCGKQVTLHTSVKKAEYDMSGVSFLPVSYIYDGSYKTVSVPETLPVGIDGIPLMVSIKGGGTDVGSYAVIVSFYVESENYLIPESLSTTVTVTPAEREVVWGNTEFTYDGTSKLPSAFYLDIHGRKVTLSPTGARSLAGEYTALAESADKNYTLKNPTVGYKINKADYDMSAACWQGGGEVYDGTEKTVILTSLPSGVSIKGYVDNKATGSGTYYAKADLAYDTENYNKPIVPTYEWHILKADYDLSLFSFSDKKVVFDGAAHYPVFSGTLPVGADGIKLTYSYSRGVTDVKDGRAAVEVIFHTESKNYKTPENQTCYVTVSPKEITVVWGSLSLVYNTCLQAPTAAADECTVTVTGGGVDAGNYIAYATSDNPNFTVINSDCPFVIEKAPNAWTKAPSVADIFFGREPEPSAEAISGRVSFVYFSDADGNDELSDTPRAVGVYFVRAECEGDKNYLPISSEILSFEIIAVVPVALNVRLEKNEYAAFEVLSDSTVAVTLVYNDGTEEGLRLSSVDIRYERAEHFLFGDTEVTLCYSDFSYTAAVATVKADYDMSGVRWENTVVIYDGREKAAFLSGLPEGVSVAEYIGNVGITAGEYPLGARLCYDEENCNPPIVPRGVLTIAKKTLPTPTVEGAVYNGKVQLPSISDTELYTVSFSDTPTSQGAYPVLFTLRDSDNYSFAGGVSSITSDFVIQRRKLTVTVASVELYLFESDFTPSFAITEGALAEGDSLTAEYTVRDGKIYASFYAPNYEITVLPGEVNNTGRLSSGALTWLLVIIFILLLLTALIFVFLRYRMRMYLAYRAAICRAAIAPVPPAPAPEEEKASEPCEREEEEHSEDISTPVSAEYADSTITNSLAKDLIRKDETVVTDGWRKGIVNVDTLSDSFAAGDRVDVNILKRRSLVPFDTAYIKVLARGAIDKPLNVYANDFSLSAVKMIALSGGKAIKVNTVLMNKKDKIDENT